MLVFPISHVRKVINRKERAGQKASEIADEKKCLLDQAVENCQVHSFPKTSEDLDVHIDLFSVLVF